MPTLPRALTSTALLMAATKAVALGGNQRDPFMHALLAMTFEKLGQAEKAMSLCEKAYNLATAHNPPAAFTRPFAREKLGLSP